MAEYKFNRIKPADGSGFIEIEGRIKASYPQDSDDLVTASYVSNVLSSVNSGGSASALQTVINGTYNSFGNPDLIVSGSGLSCSTNNINSTNNLVISFGTGYYGSGTGSVVKRVSSDLVWSALPPNTTSFLYFELTGSNVTTGFTSAAPVYSLTIPSSPATGTFWYPLNHRTGGLYYDGTIWKSALRVYAGEVTTSASAVTNIITYAYNCVYYTSVNLSSGQNVTIPNPLGTDRYSADISIAVNSPTGGYQAGDRIFIGSFFNGSGNGLSVRTGRTHLNIRTGNWAGGIKVPDGSGGEVFLNPANITFEIVSRRSF